MRYFLAVLFVIFILTSCSKEEVEVVATVNNEVLTMDEFKAFFSEQEWTELDYGLKREYVNEWIKLTLLSQEADISGLSEEAAVQERIKSAAKNVKANVLLAQKIAEIEITEDDLFNYYKLHKSKYQDTKKEYKIQRIFLKNKETLDIVMDVLQQGEPFTDVVKLYSEEQLGASGGYTGFVGKENIEISIWNKLQTLKKWHYTSAQVADGYFIFRYYDTQEVVHNKDFTDVEEDIYQIVLEQKKQQVYEQVIEDLKRNADISISL
ncbi:peptidyl-prolyl cis-trans isomerase [Candidatus Cloacimonadota bacterium]